MMQHLSPAFASSSCFFHAHFTTCSPLSLGHLAPLTVSGKVSGKCVRIRGLRRRTYPISLRRPPPDEASSPAVERSRCVRTERRNLSSRRRNSPAKVAVAAAASSARLLEALAARRGQREELLRTSFLHGLQPRAHNKVGVANLVLSRRKRRNEANERFEDSAAPAEPDVGNIVFATGGYDHSVKFWHPHDGVCYRTAQHPESQVNKLEVTPDKRLVAAAAYQQIRMYEVNSSEPSPVYVFEGISKNVTAVGFYENGQFMYSGGEDQTARIWDLRMGGPSQQCQRLFQVNTPVTSMCLHPNQSTLVVADQSGTIYVWDLSTDHNEQHIPEPDVSILGIDIDPDGAYLAAVSSKGTCYVWSLSTGVGTSPITLTPRVKKNAHSRYALKCQFSPDSSLLATTSADGTCKIWSTADFSLRNTLRKSPDRWVWDCAFSSDSQFIFTASSDHVARLWHTEKSDPVREYRGHTKPVTALAYNDSNSR